MDTKYAYYSTSKGYRVVGGTAAHFLKADGSLDNTNYLTTDTIQNVNAIKSFITSGGNAIANHSLRVYSTDGSKAGMTFYTGGIGAGNILYTGSFDFKKSDDSGFAQVSASGFKKDGSDDNSFLTAGGGSVLRSTYPTTNQADAKYIPYTGATSDLTLADKNLNFTTGALSKFQNGLRVFNKVFNNYSSSTVNTGILSFKFPQNVASATMFDITIKLYSYGARMLGTLRISFYKNSAVLINSTAGSKALIECTDTFPSTVINVGIDIDGNLRINLGEATTVWSSYLTAEVERVQSSFSGANQDYSKGWIFTIETVDPTDYQSLVNIVPDILATRSYVQNQKFFIANSIVGSTVGNTAVTTLDTYLPSGGLITGYGANTWGGADAPAGAGYGGYIKFASPSNNNNLDFYFNNGHNSVTAHRLWFRTKNSSNGVTNWFEVTTKESLASNTITSNTDQTGLTGNKTTAGNWTFNGNVISNAQYFEGGGYSKSRWLNTTSINSTNKVGYLVIDGFIESTNRQLVIEIESVAGNGQYKKLKKAFNVNFNSANDLTILASKYTEIVGRDTDVRYGIGEIEKISNTSLRIPIIWLSSNASSANQVTVKCSVGDVRNLTFSTVYDATSTLTTDIPYNTLVGSQILANNVTNAGGIDISGGNTIYLRNLLPSTRQDALTRVLRNELTSYVTNLGSTNYPAQIGAGIRTERYSSANDQRGFDIFSNGLGGQIYFKTFSSSATEGNWEMFASREWTVLQLGSYVTQASLISQLGNYATLNGVQTFSNTITFSQSPIVPDPTLLPHAVNYGFMANAIEESQNAIVGYVGGNYIPLSQKGSINGVATLDASGLIPSTQLPSYVDDVIEAPSLATLNALPAGEKQTGKIYVTTNTNLSYRWSGTVFVEISSGAVQSVNGQTGVVNLTFSDVGASSVNHTHTIAQVTGLQSALDGKVDDAQVLTNVPAGALFTDTIYTLPTATSTVKGGVEIFSDTVQSVASNSVTNTANRTYGMQLNSAGQAVVNVPWSNDNTTYTAGNGLTLSGTVFSLPVTILGSGNYITDVAQNANGITVTKGSLPSYTLLVATSNSLGGVRLITDTVNNVAPNAATTTVGRSYAVQLNNSNQAIVNVPWTDNNTTYTSSNGIALTGTNFAPTFGTTANTIAQGNDSRINNGQAAFDWGNHAGIGYAKLTSNQTFTNINTFSKSPIIPSGTLDAHAVNVSQLSTKANGQENATAIGFSSGNIPTSDGGSYPYVYHNSGSYVALATQSYVQSNFLSTPNGTSVIISGSNLNNYFKTGFYRGSGLTNAPLNNTGWWYITVETHESTWVTQKAISFGSGNTPNVTYQRTMTGGNWSDWVQIWTTRDFTTTNIQQWNYMAQYGLQLNADFTVHTGSGLMISDDHFGGESGIIDNKQRRFVAAKIGEYYKYGSGDKDGLEGINYHLEKKNIGIGGDADSENKVRVQGCVKALENFRSKDERPDTIFIPNGETATLRDEIINDESEYAIRLDPHEYEIDPSGSLEIDDRNRLIHVIGEQIKMVVDFRKIYPKQQIVIYNFDQNGGTMAVKIQGKTIASLSARCFLRLYVTKSSRVIAERQQPCEFVW